MGRKTNIDKEIVRELILKGYTYSKIAQNVDGTADQVRMCVKRNFPELLYDKNKKRQQININTKVKDDVLELDAGCGLINAADITKMQEEKKGFEENLKKYMSDEVLVRFNRQSFITNSAGKIVFDKKSRGTRPYSVPQTPNLRYTY